MVAFSLVVLVGCSSGVAGTPAGVRAWNAPPVQWVSDLGRFEHRYTYNETSAVSDGGRWVTFSSHVRERPSRLFLVRTKTNRVHLIARAKPGIDMTPDGRFVVFSSSSPSLVPHDRNRAVDIFLYDRVRREVKLVSRADDDSQANGDSHDPAISANGRYVAFDSRATNLSNDDADWWPDVYVRDLKTGATELVSQGPNGNGDGGSVYPDISDDGNRISFLSTSTNLAAGDTDPDSDVFVRDRATSTVTWASASSSGGHGQPVQHCESATCATSGSRDAHISGDGNVVVFVSATNGLVGDDNNYNDDVFTHEIDTGETERVSVRNDGGDAYGPNEVKCGQDSRCSGTSEPLTHSPSISRDGSRVYFLSAASRISDEDDDRPASKSGHSGEEVYVRDRSNGTTLLVSRYPDGSPAGSSNWYPGMISPDGKWVTYSNDSMKLDGPKGDEDPGPDVFLQRLPK